jgi:hypothetical protein
MIASLLLMVVATLILNRFAFAPRVAALVPVRASRPQRSR